MTKKKVDMAIASRTLHYYWQQVKQYKFYAIGLLFLTPAVIIIRSILVPLFAANIIELVSTGGSTEAMVWQSIFLLASYVVSSFIFDKLRMYLLWVFELKSIYNLSSNCFRTVSEQSMQFHNDRFSGSLVSQTNRFTGAFERMIDDIVFSVYPLIIQIAAILIILFPRVPIFAAILIVFIIIYTIISFLTAGNLNRLSEAEAAASNKQTGQLSDSMSNIMSVKSYAQEKFEEKRYAKFQKATYAAGIANMKGFMRRDYLFSTINIGIIAVFLYTVTFGASEFGLSISTCILIMTYSTQILGLLWDIQRIFREFSRIFGDAHDMTLVLDTPDDVVDAPDAKPLKVESGEIDFAHVDFKHHDATKAIFHDFSLDIKPGERVGLVGTSGSGKTTLTKLLLRFANIENGIITIDGQDISKVTQSTLRKNIAYVPQETDLFHRSIADNIAYAKPNATREEIIRAAKLANAHEFIVKLNDGYETMVGERGIKLSGGQRQRIAIARAILKDAPILVLDEATSALDSESEALIQEALIRLMNGRTSIVIAHRLSTVASLDRIVVLENGKIAEEGTHAELLKNGGPYQKLWSRQSGSFIEQAENED